MTQNSETMAGYPELIGYRLATAAEIDQAAADAFIPMIGEIHINGECWGWVIQAIDQSEQDFKSDVHAAEAETVRQAYRENSRVNSQIVYRLAKKGVDY